MTAMRTTGHDASHSRGSHGRCSLLPRTPCRRLDLGPFTPEVLRDGDIRSSPRRRPRGRPAGPPPNRHRPLRHRRGSRWRHRPGPGGRTGPGRLPGRARRRTPGLGTRPGLPGAMRAIPGAVSGAGGRIAPPDGTGAGTQSALMPAGRAHAATSRMPIAASARPARWTQRSRSPSTTLASSTVTPG